MSSMDISEVERPGSMDDISCAAWYAAMNADLDGLDIEEKYTAVAKAVLDAHAKAIASHTPAPQLTPVVHVNFTCQDGPVSGLTSAPVKSVTVNDDGSLRVDLDYWPASQPPAHRRGVQDAAPARPELDALIAKAKAQAPQPGGAAFGVIDPDYARVFTQARAIAWQEGYAIMMHGSFTRDLDLLAVPWTDAACEPEHLVRRIEAATKLKNISRDPGKKPHGRQAWTLTFPAFGDPRFVDLGIMPRALPTQPAGEG